MRCVIRYSGCVTIYLVFSPQCDPGVGVDAFFDIVYRKPPIVMVIGGSCSPVTEVLAEIVPFFNLIMVSISIFTNFSYTPVFKLTCLKAACGKSIQIAPDGLSVHLGFVR